MEGSFEAKDGGVQGGLWLCKRFTILPGQEELVSYAFLVLTGGYQILFYEDPAHIKPMQEKFKTYADKFDSWTDQTNGMH